MFSKKQITYYYWNLIERSPSICQPQRALSPRSIEPTKGMFHKFLQKIARYSNGSTYCKYALLSCSPMFASGASDIYSRMIVPCIELVRAKKNHIIDRDCGRRVFLDPPFPGG
jgi:hypothetical protein